MCMTQDKNFIEIKLSPKNQRRRSKSFCISTKSYENNLEYFTKVFI